MYHPLPPLCAGTHTHIQLPGDTQGGSNIAPSLGRKDRQQLGNQAETAALCCSLSVSSAALGKGKKAAYELVVFQIFFLNNCPHVPSYDNLLGSSWRV